MAENYDYSVETYDNPLQIKCEGCGAPAAYDIIKQSYHCGFCGADTDLHAPVKKLERYRELHKKELKAGNQQGTLKRFNCPRCGAVVALDTTEATATCAFCGNSMVNSEFVDSDTFPELIIPFKLTLEEAKQQLRQWIQANKGKEEAKLLESRLDALKGYYLPYEMLKGPVTCTVSRNRTERDYVCGGFVEEVAVNTNKQLNNLLLEAMEPFDWRELRPFMYGYIAGKNTKLEDTTSHENVRRVSEELKQAYLPKIEKVMQTKDLLARVEANGLLQLPALLPVYIINTGAVKVAVNGQTGRVAVEPLKETVVHRWWVEPLITVIVVAALTQIIPAFFGRELTMENIWGMAPLTAMISLAAGLIVWTASEGTSTVIKIIYLQSEKTLAQRDGAGRISFINGDMLRDNPTVEPVFREKIGKKTEPVKISFFTTGRIIKGALFFFIFSFLPNILAILLTALFCFIDGKPYSEIYKLEHSYAGAWWALFIPIMYIFWLAIVRRDIYNYPVIDQIMPDGTLKRVENLYPVDWKLVKMFCTEDPFRWIFYFVLLLLAGSLGAMLD